MKTCVEFSGHRKARPARCVWSPAARVVPRKNLCGDNLLLSINWSRKMERISLPDRLMAGTSATGAHGQAAAAEGGSACGAGLSLGPRSGASCPLSRRRWASAGAGSGRQASVARRAEAARSPGDAARAPGGTDKTRRAVPAGPAVRVEPSPSLPALGIGMDTRVLPEARRPACTPRTSFTPWG